MTNLEFDLFAALPTLLLDVSRQSTITISVFALLGAVVVTLKFWKEYTQKSPAYYLVWLYDLWRVLGFSLALTLTFTVLHQYQIDDQRLTVDGQEEILRELLDTNPSRNVVSLELVQVELLLGMAVGFTKQVLMNHVAGDYVFDSILQGGTINCSELADAIHITMSSPDFWDSVALEAVSKELGISEEKLAVLTRHSLCPS